MTGRKNSFNESKAGTRLGQRRIQKSHLGRRVLGGALAAVLGAAAGCAVGNDEAHWRGTLPARYAVDVQGGAAQVTDITYDSDLRGETELRVGDVLLAVDGTDVTNLSKEQIDSLLFGPAGSFVNLTVLRSGETVEVVVERRPQRGGQ